MTAHPDPTPEGVVIKSALTRTGLSARKAARLAGISDGRWRQIVNGYQTVAKGVHVAVRDAPAETVARMAYVAGATPDELIDAGRPDAAEELRALERRGAPERSAPATEEEVRARLLEITHRLLDAPNPEETRALSDESEQLVAVLRDLRANEPSPDGRDAHTNFPPKHHAV